MLKRLLNMDVERTELSGEIHKLTICQRLLSKNQHCVFDKRPLDGCHLLAQERLRQVEPFDLRPAIAARWNDFYAHCRLLSSDREHQQRIDPTAIEDDQSFGKQ